MEVDVLNMQGEKVSTVDLPEEIFDAPVNIDLMHQAFVRQMTNAQLGTRSTKRRSEVRGGGRKPWRQKGTGRARHGSIRSPIWVGGGKVHTPKPHRPVKDMPRNMRRAALRSALSAKAAANEIIVLEEITLEKPKTRLMVEALSRLVGDSSVLLLLPEKDDDYQTITLSARNLKHAKTLLANYLNIRDILSHDVIILSPRALDVIVGYLG
jgi:large subunit ribosomal protein L4